MSSANDAVFAREIGNLMPTLSGFARLLYRDHESAADLTQETLVKAWKARGSFAPGTNLKGWLFAIMHNHFRSEARRAWRQVPWDQVAAESIPAPPNQQLWSLELNDVARAVNTLPVRQRDALILAGLGGFTNEGAATHLRCRPTAMKSRVSRARKAVHAALDGGEQIKASRQRQKAPVSDLFNRMQRLASGSSDSAGAVAT
jgi:RNA polymerase sigma-70 factor (ECF subfamily)